MILAVILISAVASVIVIQASLTSISDLENADEFLSAQEITDHAESCMQEALIQLSRDSAYTGGSFSFNSGSCTAVISGAGSTRTLNIGADKGQYHQDISADVTLSPFTVNVWDS